MSASFLLNPLIQQALSEDLLFGDQTTEALFPEAFAAKASVIAKEALVVAGLDVLAAVFKTLDPELELACLCPDGEFLEKGATIARIAGDGRSILKAERTALNFMQRLSGIATLTAHYVSAVDGFKTKIVDTRKTTPGFRSLEKAAVRLGGGGNHRFHLGDLLMIKDNHIALAGGIPAAVKAAKYHAPHSLKIEVEVNNLKETAEAIEADVEIIMLDNMDLDQMRSAVGMIRERSPRVLIEASGNMQLDRVKAVAACGVDLISVGALTHSARAMDISLDMPALKSESKEGFTV